MDRADLEQWKGREVARLLALVETERRYYQEIVASFPIGAVIVSRGGSIVFANRAFRRLAGIRNGEPRFRTIDQVLPSAQLAAGIEETLRSLQPQSNLPVELAGQVFNASTIPLNGWEHDPEREVLIALEGAGSPQALALAPDLSDWPALLWRMHPETQQYLSIEGAQEHLLGYSPQHWISTPDFWRERIHAADRQAVVEFYRSAIRKGGEFGCEYRALMVNRQTVWRRDSFRVTLDSTGTAVRITGVTIDITARRRSEQDNLRANRVDALAGLSRRISHDFNNSLMIVTGYAEELLGNLDERDPNRADIQSIVSAAETMAGITGELSGSTRKQSSPPGATDLSAVLIDTAARIREEFGATVVLRQPQQRLSAYGDAVQLEAILVSVARKLINKADPHMIMGAGEIPVDEMPNLPHALVPGRYVEISVRGPFTPEAPVISFESLLSGKDAHGSDMARAYAIVREWGGTVFPCRTEHTSEIHIILPAMRVEQPPVPAPHSEIEWPTPAAPSAKPAATVLVVEDEQGIRGLIQKILTREGYEVLAAGDAEEAEEAARQSRSPVRLLVTDLNLAGQSGRVVASRLAGRYPELLVLFISGYADDPEATTRELGEGAPFLQKPFTLAALTRRVREILEPGS